MTSQSRKHRGYKSQDLVAQALRVIFPHAQSAGAGRTGVDITGTPGLAVEVKARRSMNLPAWLRQAAQESRAGLPVVVHRPDGFGEASILQWPVTMTLETFMEFLKRAGFGEQS